MKFGFVPTQDNPAQKPTIKRHVNQFLRHSRTIRTRARYGFSSLELKSISFRAKSAIVADIKVIIQMRDPTAVERYLDDLDENKNLAHNFPMQDEVKYHILGPDNANLMEEADVFDNPVDLVQLAAFVAGSGHEMAFASLGTKIIGMASGTVLLHPDKRPAFFINEVGVIEDMRQRGIATVLTQMLMKVARDQGCQGIWLATETDNSEARALYRKLDARETEAVVVYDWDGAMDE